MKTENNDIFLFFKRRYEKVNIPKVVPIPVATDNKRPIYNGSLKYLITNIKIHI